MSTTSDESFLARWSRLKRRPAETNDVEAPPGAPTPLPNEEERAIAVRSGGDGEADRAWSGEPGQAGDEAGQSADERQMRDFSDFDYDKLDFESDYAQFMKDDVPEDARNKALRQLWRSNPVLANMDGLDDYCEDYTDAAMVPIGGIKTAYQIGKGFLTDAEVAEWEALGRPERAEVAVADDGDEAEEDGLEDDHDRSEDLSVEAASSGEASVMPGDGDCEDGAAVSAGSGSAGAGGMSDAGAAIDVAGAPGAACAAALKREELFALEDYAAEQKSASKDDTAS